MTRKQALDYIERNLDLLADYHSTARTQVDREIDGGRWRELYKCKEIINKCFDDFEEELKKAYIEGSNDNYKAMKDAGKLK